MLRHPDNYLVACIKRAHAWLSSVRDDVSERQCLWVALALLAAECVSDIERNSFSLYAQSLRLPADEAADPVVVLSVQNALRRRGLGHQGLQELAAAYAEGLLDLGENPDPRLNLVIDLLDLCSFKGQQPLAVRNTRPFGFPDLVVLGKSREDVLCESQRLGCITSLGRRNLPDTSEICLLPSLCLAYASDGDIGVVSALVRVGSALGLVREAAVNWSIDWLLDQQNPEGHFGLLPVELGLPGSGSLSLRTELTVAAILALAEYVKPGWLWSNLEDGCDQGGRCCDLPSLESVSNRFDAVQPA